MTQPSSPRPPGTTETAIWFDAEGRQLPGPEGAARGEVEVRFPDGRVERHYLTTVANT